MQQLWFRSRCRFVVLMLLGIGLVVTQVSPAIARAEVAFSPSRSPDSDPLVWQLIGYANEVLLPDGQTGQARQAALSLQAYPLSAEAQAYTHYLLALTASYEDDYATALVHYQAMQICGGSMATLIGGMDGEISVQMLADDYAEATNAAETLIATIQPTDTPNAQEYRAGAAYQIGEMLYRQARYTDALAQFRRVVSSFADTSWVSAAHAKVDDLSAIGGGVK